MTSWRQLAQISVADARISRGLSTRVTRYHPRTTHSVYLIIIYDATQTHRNGRHLKIAQSHCIFVGSSGRPSYRDIPLHFLIISLIDAATFYHLFISIPLSLSLSFFANLRTFLPSVHFNRAAPAKRTRKSRGKTLQTNFATPLAENMITGHDCVSKTKKKYNRILATRIFESHFRYRFFFLSLSLSLFIFYSFAVITSSREIFARRIV